MPFAGFDDWDDCVSTMTDEERHDQEAAENICGALQAESKAEHGDPEGLMQAIQNGAGLIADVGVDLVSGVDVPAVDSKWVMTKSGGARKGHDYRAASPVLLSKDDGTDGESEQRIAYAAAMIPREPDKEGDVVATPTVEAAAHDFIKQQGGVDTDHSLIDGEGEVVESWVLKDERTFDLPGGETETYGPGTWMVGIEWGAQAWDRIKAGELTGLSIYGMAEHVALKGADLSGLNACPHCDGDLSAATAKAETTANGDSGKRGESDTGDMGDQTDETSTDAAGDGADGADGDGGGADPALKDLRETVDDLADTVSAVKEAVETEKQDARDAAELLAEEMGFEDAEAVLDALSEKENDGDMDDDDEYDEEDKATGDGDAGTETAEKRADDANLSKGSDGTATAQKGVTDDGGATSGMPSYSAVAAEHEEGH